MNEPAIDQPARSKVQFIHCKIIDVNENDVKIG